MHHLKTEPITLTGAQAHENLKTFLKQKNFFLTSRENYKSVTDRVNFVICLMLHLIYHYKHYQYFMRYDLKIHACAKTDDVEGNVYFYFLTSPLSKTILNFSFY